LELRRNFKDCADFGRRRSLLVQVATILEELGIMLIDADLLYANQAPDESHSCICAKG
jgi:hypothetical protein